MVWEYGGISVFTHAFVIESVKKTHSTVPFALSVSLFDLYVLIGALPCTS